MVNIGNEWDQILEGEFDKEYYLTLRKFLIQEYKTKTIYPSMYDIFNALKMTSYGDVKAVILGQDPYHGPNQAHGLCFSVREGVPAPPSLVNIYKELQTDIPGFEIPNHGYLESWARQGVLMLNAVLTVRGGAANSHKGKGWETFTNQVIQHLNQRETPMVFLLWGNHAKSKMNLITNPRHLVLTAAHPSPLSAFNGFFGCKHFSITNQFLEKNGMTPIDWRLPIEL